MTQATENLKNQQIVERLKKLKEIDVINWMNDYCESSDGADKIFNELQKILGEKNE